MYSILLVIVFYYRTVYGEDICSGTFGVYYTQLNSSLEMEKK